MYCIFFPLLFLCLMLSIACGWWRFVVDSQICDLWVFCFRSIIFCLHAYHLTWCPSFSGFYRMPLSFLHVQYLSILVRASWTMVNFPHVVLTFICTSKAPVGILQKRYSFRSQFALSDWLNAILKEKFCKNMSNSWLCCWYLLKTCLRNNCYSHSHSRLYHDFHCFNIMYTCIRSLLPNKFLTFNLWKSGTRGVVGKCISLLSRIMWVFPQFITNMSHIQFFFRVTLSDDSSPISLNKCAFQVDWFKLVIHKILCLLK